MNDSLAGVYPVSSRLTGEFKPPTTVADFPAYLQEHQHLYPDFPFLAELAALEAACHQLRSLPPAFPLAIDRLQVNPTVQILACGWIGLPEFITTQEVLPQQGEALVLLYRPTADAPIVLRTPSRHDLLALKMVVEGIGSREAASEAGVGIAVIDGIMAAAVRCGLILAPPSRLVRDESFLLGPFVDPEQGRVATFTLQWHITQACDLHCRHCYDRSSRTTMPFDQAIRVLDQLDVFTRANHVDAQISFSGGNPLLYPDFLRLYQAAVDRGFLVALLGNPTDEETLSQVLAIAKPEFYQVSLEGLPPHNDYIRGAGHFDRVVAFLELLRRHGVYSMVMLTLTRANADQVLPLAETLRGKTDLFTFNRLAMVGEGAELASLEPERLAELLTAYLTKAADNRCMATKDNFFNLILAEQGRPLTGGCTGFGCGAAFNFVSVLPDGEVHACRKFPSLIGNIFSQSLSDIYFGEMATRYRAGSSSCRTCDLRPVCRGCPAVSYGFGRDVFTDLDPYCFKKDPSGL